MKSVLFILSLLFFTVNIVNSGVLSTEEIEQVQKIHKERPFKNGSLSREEVIIPAGSTGTVRIPSPKPPRRIDQIDIQHIDLDKYFSQ